ncbi:MAG: DNA adenine methylase [Flavonifractor plautii]
MRRIAKPFFPWVGGKLFLLPYIFQLLPRRAPRLLEVCGGSGAVTLGLGAGYAPLRVYNDVDVDLVNLFRCARDRPLALLRELDFLPLHARADFEVVLRFLNHGYDPNDFLEEELQIAEEYFPPMDRQEVKKLLMGRANLPDVQRVAAYYLSIRYSYSATGNSFGGRGGGAAPLPWPAPTRLGRTPGRGGGEQGLLRCGSAVRPDGCGDLCGPALSGGGEDVRALLCPPGSRPAPRLPVRPGGAGQPHRPVL